MTRASDDWQKWYAALRNAEPEAYRQAVQHAEGIVLQYHLGEDNKLSAAIEVSHVMLACSLLGVRP